LPTATDRVLGAPTRLLPQHSHDANRIQPHRTALNGSQPHHAISRFSITAGQDHDRPTLTVRGQGFESP